LYFIKIPPKKGNKCSENPFGFKDLTQMFALKFNCKYLNPSVCQGVFNLDSFFTKKELFKPILRVERDPQVSTAQSSTSFLNLQLHWKKWIMGAMPHS